MAKRNTRAQSKETPDAQELLVLELQEIHSAENQLSRVLPRLSKVVESDALREMLDQRLNEGSRIIGDIETVLQDLDESPGRKKNVAAEGLIEDAREHVQEIEAGPALDAVLIGAIQKTEHYCIAAWGTAKALAKATNQGDAVRAMERALKEGGKLDQQLTELAEREITPALMAEGDEGEDEGSEGQTAPAARGRSRKDGEQRAGR